MFIIVVLQVKEKTTIFVLSTIVEIEKTFVYNSRQKYKRKEKQISFKEKKLFLYSS